MRDLQEKVEKMLDGEKKRREVALKWISEIEDILLPASKDIWGDGDVFGDVPSWAVEITDDVYFKYSPVCGNVGFYNHIPGCSEGNTSGELVENIQGSEFWYTVQVIMKWLPHVIDVMDKEAVSRDVLIAKLV